MWSSSAFSLPSTPPRALFPQECSHDIHHLNSKGDLYTALITGGSRLLLLKNGVVLAQSGPLFDEVASASAGTKLSHATTSTGSAASTASKTVAVCTSSDPTRASKTSAPCVCAVSLCCFAENVFRVAVATVKDVLLFELDDIGQIWRDTQASSFLRASEGTDATNANGTDPPSSSAASPLAAEGAPNRYPAVHGRSNLFHTTESSSLTTARPHVSHTASGGGPTKGECESTGRLRWRRLSFHLSAASSMPRPGHTEVHTASVHSSTPYRDDITPKMSSTSATADTRRGGAAPVPVRMSAPLRPSVVRAMDFVSEDTVCVVMDSEAMLIVLGNAHDMLTTTPPTRSATAAAPLPDRIIWRAMGDYRKLAVCRANHHVALALGHDTIVVFPSCVVSRDGRAPMSFSVCPNYVDGCHFGPVASATAAASLHLAANSEWDGAHAITTREMSSCSIEPTSAFSTTSHLDLTGGCARAKDQASTAPGAFPSLIAGGDMALAERGLTASVGIYHITDMEWSSFSSRTLLCVTCVHPQDATTYMMLYTLQSLSSTRRYTNVMEEYPDGGWGLCRGGNERESLNITGAGLDLSGGGVESIVQLVPAGVIALKYISSSLTVGSHAHPCAGSNTASLLGGSKTSLASAADTALHDPLPQSEAPDVAALSPTAAGTTWGGAPPPPIADMHTSLVPNYSRNAEANSMGSRMEFLHIEGDGTVRTSSYLFGRLKHASFAKQRAVGLACMGLLKPLLHRYGTLVKVTVLPKWRTRPIELGNDTRNQPCAMELTLSASRRYRMVLRFRTGVVLAVMVDLSAAVYRVECFLALGRAPVLSLRTVEPFPESARIQDDQPQSPAWRPAGSSMILIAGLLGSPTPASPHPDASQQPQVQASLSTPEAVKAGARDWKSVRPADAAMVTSAEAASSSASAFACSLRSVDPASAHPVAAMTPPRTVWGVVLLQVESSGMQARVLTVTPLADTPIPGVSVPGEHDGDGGGSGVQSARQQPSAPAATSESPASVEELLPTPLTVASTVASGGNAAQVSEKEVVSFMAHKCPEKLRFMPALLKAAQGDPGRLLKQLVAKYGVLEESVDVAQVPRGDIGNDDTAAKAVPMMPCPPAVVHSLSVLTGCCVGAGGEILLLVRADAPCGSTSGDGGGGGDAALIRLRPPCLEVFASVHRLATAGCCYIPFEPAEAEYVLVPAEVQQRWRSQPLMPPRISSTCATASGDVPMSAQEVREAFCACQRVAASAERAAVVRCEVVLESPGKSFLRVRSPVSPGAGEGTVQTLRHSFPLPSSMDPKSITRVVGSLLLNNDVVIGVLSRSSEDSSAASSILYLYGCPAVQSLEEPGAVAAAASAKPSDSTGFAASSLPSNSSAFSLEAMFPGVEAFFLSASGEVVLMRRRPAQVGASPLSAESATAHGLRFERWMRCFPEEDTGGYSYVQDCTWCPPCGTAGGLAGIGEDGSPVTPDRVTALMTVNVARTRETSVGGLSALGAAMPYSHRMCTCHALYATAEGFFIQIVQLPLRSSSTTASASGSSWASVMGEAAIPQYHPDALLQLIGMARWTVLARVLTCVADAVKAVLTSAEAGGAAATVDGSWKTTVFAESPGGMARYICTSAVERDFQQRSEAVDGEEVLRRVAPPQLSVAALLEEEMLVKGKSPAVFSSVPSKTATARLYDLSATCSTLVEELTQLLPRVVLSGLESQDHLKLLCLLQALRDTLPLSRSVDEAAARHLFYSRYVSLGRRSRLMDADTVAAVTTDSSAPINSVLHFEAGRTAARTVETAAFFWAAMSDSQSSLVSLLFDKTSPVYLDGGTGGGGGGGGGSAGAGGGSWTTTTMAGGTPVQDLTWEQVKQSGVALWLRSAADLRAMADRVARHQYQSTKDLTACALMYCTARKLGTLAALAKAQNNQRLHAFFSRDFSSDPHHRAAASANAYAAISKNMPQYGAAFFLLAGDVWSAAQVLLQRCHDPSLALFVLRAASDAAEEPPPAAETPLEWYIAQRSAEADTCGALDMWELACLNWIDVAPPLASPEVTVQRHIRALKRISAHLTAHSEALCALRYARNCVAALAYRGNQFLSPAHEVVCLLRLGRYCVAQRLNMNAYLHYRDAEALLRGLRTEAAAAAAAAAARSGTLHGAIGCGGVYSRAPPQTAKMTADFNTGTLHFHGFESDSDDDDDDQSRGGGSGDFLYGRQSNYVAAAGDNGSGLSLSAFVLSEEAVAAVEAEVQYAYARTGAVDQQSGDGAGDVGGTVPTGTCEEILRRMLLSLTASSSYMMTSSAAAAGGSSGGGAAEAVFVPSYAVSSSSSSSPESSWALVNPPESFEQLLTSLLHLLSIGDMKTRQERRGRAGNPNSLDSAQSGSPGAVQDCLSITAPLLNSITPTERGGGEWYALCIPLLHFLLSNVALRGANYVVLLALQQIPVSTEGVLEAALQERLLSDCSVALRGDSVSPPTYNAVPAAMGTAPLPASPFPLYDPLSAFFRLLGYHMRRHLSDACKADGGCFSGERAATSGGTQQTASGGKECMRGAAGEEVAAEDDAMHAGSEDGSRTHQNMFDALLAAAATTEGATNRARAARGISCAARGSCSVPSTQAGADGFVGDADKPGHSVPLCMTDSAQVSLLLSCCQAQLQLRLMHHLKRLVGSELEAAVVTPTTRRAMDAGILHSDALSSEAQAALTQCRLLLCTLLLDVTLQWCMLSEECMMSIYAAQPQYALCPLTDPNGVFLEAQRTVKMMMAVLVAVVDASPRRVAAVASHAAAGAFAAVKSVSGGEAAHHLPSDPVAPSSEWSTLWLNDSTLMLELCMIQIKLFWTLPAPTLAQCGQLAAPTRAALRLLQGSAALRSPARSLLRRMLRPLKVAADPLAECSGLGNTVAALNNDTSRVSQQDPFSFFSAVASPPAFWFSMTRAGSPSSPGVKQWPGEQQLCDDHSETYCPALSYLQLAWLRRHHTHALLRWLLLMITLNRGQGHGPHPVGTDRLILAHHNHSVTGVHFDASSCDSVVWTTEKGTSTGHGFRELLAGDNEEALWRQATERNLATSAFTLELAAQHKRLRLATEHAEQQHTSAVIAAVSAKSVLDSRPLCHTAADVMPSSHPHLPFFVSRHRDGHLDLYPFASPECVASFRCAVPYGQSAPVDGSSASDDIGKGSGGAAAWRARGAQPASAAGGTSGSSSLGRSDCFAVTPVAFSPNGYIIAVGLSDGSVAAWRFAAGAVESPPVVFLPHLFAPSGIRACTFCGARGSLVAVVGVTREPHQHRHSRFSTGLSSSVSMGADTPLPAFTTSLGGSPSASFSASANATQGSTSAGLDAGELVGEVLILDIMLGAGAIMARCALPFIASYAVYITPLRAVLMVSVDGKMATYAVATGRLAVLGTVSVTTVLRSALGPSLGADDGDAGPGATSSTSSASGSDSVHITCVACSSYDPLVALGVSNGLVLLLHFHSIRAAMARTERRIRDEGEDIFVYYQPSPPYPGDDTTDRGGNSSKRREAQRGKGAGVSSPASAALHGASEVAAPAMGSAFLEQIPETTVLREAKCMQVAPHINSRSAIEDVVFSPSMLLAGLRDGKVMAASLIARLTRARLTAGCAIPIHLLECV
ncbi:hypothetical protein JKF63_06402 [Porcisia hertigi]|uniref:RAVE complex protein Rav1 C-terminal domain-containing protein n=1 Tax=Porcisia hertigi TaxID=2761500 RepID=A0A837A9F0_9TRYP|nr:hypothetical protein JKF63_06402 [Porcisia hertigi]